MANIRDLYMRPEGDPSYIPDQIEVYDEIEATVNQVKMTLLTNKGEVLGEPLFGLSIEKYLFDFEIDPFILSEDAQSQITKYVSESKKRKIKVTPSYMLNSKEQKVYALKIDIDAMANPFAILYD